jgi:hypothetical protein
VILDLLHAQTANSDIHRLTRSVFPDEFEGGIYHLLRRGGRREDNFWDNVDRKKVLELTPISAFLPV